ncbi:MAG: MFS transporter [Candidatus Thorarchaeota archaeon]|nr:MFS transporter [Candidatus Thorarchaeota archaeon]
MYEEQQESVSRIYAWLGVESLSDDLRKSIRARLIINFPRIFAGNFLIITLTLFYLDTLNPLEVGAVWGVYFTTLALLDYLSRTLGDTIGYKRVLIGAYLSKLIAIPFLIFGTSFIWYAAFMILLAVGDSQESGALEAWFDNYYRPRAESEDPERKIHTQFIARVSPVYSLVTICGFVIGGFVATEISRQTVFAVFAFLLAIELLLIQKVLWETVENKTKQRLGDYLGRIRQSLSIFINSRTIFFYFLGIAAIWAANESVWHTFISIRIYLEYTGSDAGAGILRSAVFASALLWQLLVIKFIDRFKRPHLWVFLSTVVSNAMFFAMIMVYYQFVPPTGVDLLPVIGIILLYQIPASWESLQGTLQQRINLDLIPDEHRNSLYSLLPTLARIFGIPFVMITGYVTDIGGFVGSFYWLIAVSFIGSILLGIGLLFGADSKTQPSPDEVSPESD